MGAVLDEFHRPYIGRVVGGVCYYQADPLARVVFAGHNNPDASYNDMDV